MSEQSSSNAKTCVSFDTNTFFGNLDPESATWRALRTCIAVCGVQVLITQVVLDEIISKLFERTVEQSKVLDSALHEANSALHKLRFNGLGFFDDDLGIDGLQISRRSIVPPPVISHEVATSRFMQTFRCLCGQSPEILPFPSVTHEVLVKKCLDARRPFRKKDYDRGYRDALIWFSLLEFAQKNSGEVYFISANTSDFGDNDDWHSDFSSDLKLANCESRFFLVNEPMRFVKKFSHHIELATQKIRAQVERELTSYTEDIRNLIENYLREHQSYEFLYPRFTDVTVNRIALKFVDPVMEGDDDLFCSISVDAECVIDSYTLFAGSANEVMRGNLNSTITSFVVGGSGMISGGIVVLEFRFIRKDRSKNEA